MTAEIPASFPPGAFMREDENDDSLFYQDPRLVVHIDDGAIAAIGELYKEVIPPDSVILDLMSSWRSHWPSSHPEQLAGQMPGQMDKQGSSEAPPGAPGKKMIGLGLNAVEMQENPDLDDYVVHDVNRDPRLPFDDCTFDAAVIAVSVQYLTRPIEVFRDVNRILRPGGVFLVTFSNRMFPTKAIRIWNLGSDEQRMQLVASYFHYAGNYEDTRGTCRNLQRGPYEDPVYVVMARKPSLSSC